ncbi:MAG TPA: transketolase, partial [Anaerolineaceae bacterium]|nr:transketolase [Anaerolineaceae bacterium]
LYDDNHISIDGSTDLAFTEDRAARFEAYHWHVVRVADGNDVEAIDAAIQAAKEDERPSLIVCRTTIGYGLPTRQGTSKAHGEPPGDEELNAAKQAVGWPLEPRFYVPEDVLAHYRQALTRGAQLEAEWQNRLAAYQHSFPERAVEFGRRLNSQLPNGWQNNLPEFPADAKGMATRAASGKMLNALAATLPELTGGSADLAPSTNTWLQGLPAFQAGQRDGRNFHFGVRENGMGSVVNGMALHKGLIPYGATFFVFTDYMRPAIRISALSHIPSIWVMTHDSIGLGEDGPTHQPVEHLAAMRAIPNLVVIRPADANETREAWKIAIQRGNGPTMLVLSRQNTPTLDRSVYASADGLQRGAYVLADLGSGKPEIILMATGTEVALIVEAGKKLAEQGKSVRLVSFPSWELFSAQDAEYRARVLPAEVTCRVAVEAGISQGWERWIGERGKMIGVQTFGASAPVATLYHEYGLTVENILATALS